MPTPTNAQKARARAHLVVAELLRRGAVNVTLGEHRRSTEILASDVNESRTVTLRVKTKTTGDWQTTSELGEPREQDPGETRFWVLVDIGTDPSGSASYFVVPEWWILNCIHGRSVHLAARRRRGVAFRSAPASKHNSPRRGEVALAWATRAELTRS